MMCTMCCTYMQGQVINMRMPLIHNWPLWGDKIQNKSVHTNDSDHYIHGDKTSTSVCFDLTSDQLLF